MTPTSLILIAFFSAVSFGAELYPKSVPIRFFGSDQGPVGSCQSEAEVGALEQGFANRGYAIKLSAYYRHARIWMGTTPEELKKKDLQLVYTPEDIKLLNAAGSLIPDYMWPEDGEGFDLEQSSKIRPTVTAQAVIDPTFPTADSQGFRRDWFEFGPKGLADIKAAVSAGTAVVISVHGDVFDLFDSYTGLLKEPYSSAAPAEVKVMGSEINHAIAVVGFDDNLQALVIRNSWNTPLYKTVLTNGRMNGARLEALRSFRLKVYPQRNLPGYFALPYAYVNDLVARHLSGFWTYSLDYESYADQYFKFRDRYKVVYAPFSCDPQMVSRSVDAYANDLRAIDKAKSSWAWFREDVGWARKQMLAIAESEVRRVPGDFAFSYAKLPVNKNMPAVDRVREFYDGRFVNYYCGQSPSHWPSPDFNKARGESKDIDKVLEILSSVTGSSGAWMQWFNLLSLLKEKGYSI